MARQFSYLDDNGGYRLAVVARAIDRDVERGENLLMAGFCAAMLVVAFAPFSKPTVVLPLIALVFALSASLARVNYVRIEGKLAATLAAMRGVDRAALRPVMELFAARPPSPLADAFDLLKNKRRVWKSVLGGIFLNPLWIPIFYAMCFQISEEKNLLALNTAVQRVLDGLGD